MTTEHFSNSQRLEYLRQYGAHSMAFSTLQPGLRYLDVPDSGYVAYKKIGRLFPTRFVLGDPICSRRNLKKLLRDLSGGEKQRVAIARGLVGEPDLLLADEPTSQLDSHSAETVSEMLREAVREYRPAVILATHDPRLSSIADYQLTLEDGTCHA